MQQDGLGGALGCRALLRLIASSGHDGQRALCIALVGIDVDAQHIIRAHLLRKGDPLLQADLHIRLPGQVDLHIFVVLQKIVPAGFRNGQIDGRLADQLAVIFHLRAGVQSAVTGIQDDDHILLRSRHRHSKQHRHGQHHSQQSDSPSFSH